MTFHFAYKRIENCNINKTCVKRTCVHNINRTNKTTRSMVLISLRLFPTMFIYAYIRGMTIMSLRSWRCLIHVCKQILCQIYRVFIGPWQATLTLFLVCYYTIIFPLDTMQKGAVIVAPIMCLRMSLLRTTCAYMYVNFIAVSERRHRKTEM